jgi:hypothetical protein
MVEILYPDQAPCPYIKSDTLMLTAEPFHLRFRQA